MSLQTMPIDTTALEFRYHGASEYRAYNSDVDQREKDQARDEDTGYPIYTIRCQVIYRDVRESGLITVRVPLPKPPADDMEFEHPITFTGVSAKTWRMDGRDGQTWTAQTMTTSSGGRAAAPPTPPKETAKAGSLTSRRQATTNRRPAAGVQLSWWPL